MHDYKEEDITSLMAEEEQSREALTAKWLELWSLYKTRPIKVADNDGWKSQLNDGRVFELVETVASYIRNAMFYSDRWVSLESNEPDLAEILPLVTTYFADCLNSSNLKREFRVFLSQLLLTGFSSLLVYWDEEVENLAFQAVNSYDMFIESSRRYDERFSYSFRKVELNYAEFCSWVEEGLIEIEEDKDKAWERYAEANNIRQAELYNLRDTIPVNDRDSVIVCEYYCPEKSTIYRYIDDECVSETEVDECPWLIGLLFETPEDAYALSLVESSIGLVLANNILHNRRLDNIALSIDNMWLMVDDGVVNPEDIRSEPGKVITVGQPGTLTPLQPPANNFNVTYQEQQVLDTKIDRNIGTGNMISANTARNGERVTKAEIEATKDAGGNRLTDLFEHIEATVILPLLKRAFNILKANTKKPKVVKLASNRPNIYDYFKMLPEDLKHDYSFKITGTQSVINRDRNVSLISEFITLVGSVPQFQELIDFKNLYYDLLVKFGFDDPSRYILSEQPEAEPAPQAPQSPLQQLGDKALEIGGDPFAQALQEQTALGNAPQAVADLGAIQPNTQAQTDPAALTAATQFLSTPQI
jgi:hypothetical protein